MGAVLDRLRAARRVQVIGHVRPDGDCIGSLLAAHHLLDHFGVEHALATGDLRANGWTPLRDFDRIEAAPRSGFQPDVTLFVDCADLARALPDGRPEGRTVNVDHHGGNTMFAEINWVEPRCAAVGEMLFYLAEAAGAPLTPDLANAVLLAIMTDTGGFRYSNVEARHFRIAADLVEAGADVTLINRVAFENLSPETFAIMGRAFADVRFGAGGRLAWSELRLDTVRRLGGAEHMPSDLGAELRLIDGVELAVVLVELPEGGARLSFRSKGGVDVSALAAKFGGGGHPNASGATVADRPFDAARAAVLEAAEAALGAGGAKSASAV
jgi:phosphoesterase RecJ-like protein